ncbi:MAG: Metal dependent phosphohydrolase [Candidatus Woesebacteria bacterium GW2011_GWA1_39_21]|uniref:Metal dependent phosphohydrolase n=1 Tax=Candidatus Woesebacteria bacterium GW2011_GWA1_39_21 TaxID=1618550 RepID=A0A0G0NEQ3_9BACT|nr:MAG: Metal dependent phosphohydrolase [Candidatus Woesebacteria bacterium GW2011_GWA1_39_21]
MVTKLKSKEESFDIHLPLNGNALLEKTLYNINLNVEIRTLWKVINVNAIERLGMSDHGPVHFQIVANIALRLARLLQDAGVKMSITKNYDLSDDYAEVVVLCASLFHDLGMSIEREGHETFSLILANNILRETLSFLPLKEKTIVASEILHAIISHRAGGRPLTIEAGIVRVADALDMSEGRSRIPYEAGEVNIHSVSAAAIDKVEIRKGKEKPILVNIMMNNSAGIFQIDDLLKSKVKGSGLEKFIDVIATMSEKGEKKLIDKLSFKEEV